MTDKLSSPTASSNSGSASTPLKSIGEDETFLTIRKQPSQYVFPDEVIEVEFALETRGSKYSPPTDVEIVACLECRAGTNASLVLLDGPPIRVSPSRGTGKLRCKISGLPKTACSVTLSAKDHLDVFSVTTRTIHLVSAKIRALTTDEWDNLWYKDEGGRDKSMEVIAEAYDKDNMLVRDRIPLNLTLCYDADTPVQVTNQEILKLQGSERRLQIDKSTGRARIRFRVEEVSKNHQGQNFSLMIAAEKKSDYEIAPGYTPGVSVRSKRNKRHRASNSVTSARGASGTESTSPTMMRSSPVFGEHSSMTLDGADPSRIREAMQGMLHWTDEVVNGLYSVQWQIIGYAQHPDGSPDYNRPYHSMPNPNPLISQILSRYTDSVRGNLRQIQHAIEQTDMRRRDEPAYNPMNSAVAPLPRESEGVFGMMPPPGVQRARRASPHSAVLPAMSRMGAPGTVSLSRGPPPPVMLPGEAPFRGDFPPLQQQRQQMHTGYYPPPQVRQHDPDNTQLRPPQGILDGKKTPQIAALNPDLEDSGESEVEYVLAKQYKSTRSSDRLGFPAYSVAKELLGFYRESSNKVGVGQFIPIRHLSHEFGPFEIVQATTILQEEMANKSEAVHALKDWGSIGSLIDHALVYDWSKGVDGAGNANQQESVARLS